MIYPAEHACGYVFFLRVGIFFFLLAFFFPFAGPYFSCKGVFFFFLHLVLLDTLRVDHGQILGEYFQSVTSSSFLFFSHFSTNALCGTQQKGRVIFYSTLLLSYFCGDFVI